MFSHEGHTKKGKFLPGGNPYGLNQGTQTEPVTVEALRITSGPVSRRSRRHATWETRAGKKKRNKLKV